MEIANVDCSCTLIEEFWDVLGSGTGIYALIREALDCFCIEYSGNACGACMLTAKPLKQGMLLSAESLVASLSKYKPDSRQLING